MNFKSIANVKRKLEKANYICSKIISTVVYLAEATQKPILIEGPAGVGKTERKRGQSLYFLSLYFLQAPPNPVPSEETFGKFGRLSMV